MEYTVVAEFYEGPLDEDKFLRYVEADNPDHAIEKTQQEAKLQLLRAFPEYMNSGEPDEDDASPILKIWAVFEGHHKDLSD